MRVLKKNISEKWTGEEETRCERQYLMAMNKRRQNTERQRGRGKGEKGERK